MEMLILIALLMPNITQYVSFPLYRVSELELFLLIADPAIIDCLFGFIAAGDLFQLSSTSQRLHATVEFYIQRVWTHDTFFAPWFGGYNIGAAVRKIESCNAIVGGSAVLRFLMRQPPYEDSDMDIFVPLEHLLEFGRWIQSVGYAYKPRGFGIFTFFDVAALSLPGRLNANVATEEGSDLLSFGVPFEVFDFLNEGTVPQDSSRRRRIQVIAVAGDPKRIILSFHSSKHICCLP